MTQWVTAVPYNSLILVEPVVPPEVARFAREIHRVPEIDYRLALFSFHTLSRSLSSLGESTVIGESAHSLVRVHLHDARVDHLSQLE